MTTAIAIALTGVLIFLAHLFVILFKRTRIPDALLLIGIGILLGPVFHWVKPEHLGKVGPIFSMLALAVILFEGGLETRISVLRHNWQAALGLILPAFLATLIAGAFLIHSLTGLGFNRSLLMGAILASASPSIILPMARHLDMRSGPLLILTLETAVTDVLCVVIVLGFIAAYVDGAFSIGMLIRDIGVSFGLSALLGCLAGLGWSLFLDRLRLVRNNIFLTLALVLVLFGGLEIIHLSGGIAVLCFGAAITNSTGLSTAQLAGFRLGRPTAFTDREKAFFSETVFLLKTFFFVYLGLSLRFADTGLILLAFGLAAVKIAIRIPLVRQSLPRGESVRDASLMPAMVSLGLAPAVLATLPLQAGMEGGEVIRDLTYATILASILANSVLVFLIDRTSIGKIYGKVFAGFAPSPAPESQESPDHGRPPAPRRQLESSDS